MGLFDTITQADTAKATVKTAKLLEEQNKLLTAQNALLTRIANRLDTDAAGRTS